MTKVVGITGSMGTGKTTVSNILKAEGVPVINADLVTHEIENNNKEIINKIKHTFGDEVVTNGKVNRKKLSMIVFSSPTKLQVLLDILKPLTYQVIKYRLAHFKEAGFPLVILEAPLLLEQGYQSLVDEIILISCSKKLQLERLKKRNLSLSEIKKRLSFQWPLAKKKKWSNKIIDNSESIAKLKMQVLQWLKDTNNLNNGGRKESEVE